MRACKQTPGCGNSVNPHSYRLGNPAPMLYQDSTRAPVVFHINLVFSDITYGNNAVPFTLGLGYGDLDPGFLAHRGTISQQVSVRRSLETSSRSSPVT